LNSHENTYVVIKAYKITVFEILRDFLYRDILLVYTWSLPTP